MPLGHYLTFIGGKAPLPDPAALPTSGDVLRYLSFCATSTLTGTPLLHQVAQTLLDTYCCSDSHKSLVGRLKKTREQARKHSTLSVQTVRKRKEELEKKIFITYSSSPEAQSQPSTPVTTEVESALEINVDSSASPEPVADQNLSPVTAVSPVLEVLAGPSAQTQVITHTFQSRNLRERKRRRSLQLDSDTEGSDSDTNSDSDFEPDPRFLDFLTDSNRGDTFNRKISPVRTLKCTFY
ncbi:uncharacterized protein LOC134821764 isoform X3 [Bolinopsis microptera]|uniref:uncharacterized protein LOC134821764 isoform X3 n=1 Tax=Bolinopsis microptera TaxID=2820187 RepID=UPI00307AA32F